MKKECGKSCEVMSRVVGYYRTIENFNIGAKQMYHDRKTFNNLSDKSNEQD